MPIALVLVATALLGGCEFWFTKAAMSTARSGLAAVVAGDQILVFGGQGTAPQTGLIGSLDLVERYDTARNRWTAVTPMPTPRDQISAAVLGDEHVGYDVYVVGGESSIDGSVLDTFDALDTTTDTWSSLSPLPEARAGIAFEAGDDGRLYAMGGYGTNCQLSGRTDIYDPATDSWSVGAPMPTARRGAAHAKLRDGRILVIGGNTECGVADHMSSLVEAYDPTTNTWESLASMPTARWLTAAAAGRDGRVYVAGGINPAMNGTSGYMSLVEIYEPVTDSWTDGAPMSVPRADLAVVSTSRGIFAIGGERSGGPADEVEQLLAATTIAACGSNFYGELGDGTGEEQADPVRVANLFNATDISTLRQTLAVRSDGTVWGWGYNNAGQLGDGTQTDRRKPVQVPGLRDMVGVAAGRDHGLALREDGTVWAWGSNFFSQLGQGTRTNRPVLAPVQVVGLGDVVAIDAGEYYSVALRRDGTVWTWGYNAQGQLGDGTGVSRWTPVQVVGLTGVTAIAAGEYHVLASRQDGSAWAWGGNGFGQLGDGTTSSRYAPVRIPGLTGITGVSGGSWHSLAVAEDHTVRAWGANNFGQLGDGSYTNRITPIVVPGLTGITSVSAGSFNSAAVRADGTLWTWGNSGYGRLCLGDGVASPLGATSATRVPNLQGVIRANAGDVHTLAITTR